MTTNQAAKLAILRAEALAHGDPDTVTLVDAALAGDAEALTTLRDALRSLTKRRASWASNAHPWTHDEEN